MPTTPPAAGEENMRTGREIPGNFRSGGSSQHFCGRRPKVVIIFPVGTPVEIGLVRLIDLVVGGLLRLHRGFCDRGGASALHRWAPPRRREGDTAGQAKHAV